VIAGLTILSRCQSKHFLATTMDFVAFESILRDPKFRGTDFDRLWLSGVEGCKSSSMNVFLMMLPSQACLERNSGDVAGTVVQTVGNVGVQLGGHGSSLEFQISVGNVKCVGAIDSS